MSQVKTSPEVTFVGEHSEGTGRIWKTFWVLTALTIVELALGFLMYKMGHGWAMALPTKIVIGVLTLLKAYYIVSVFMHLGDEVRNLIMTIIVPLILFIWFIGAFLWDGGSWKNMRKNNAAPKEIMIEKVIPKAGH